MKTKAKANTAPACPEKGPLTKELLGRMDRWFRAANYLSACQLYLLNDPLLETPLTKEDITKKIVGHWGTCPGQNFIYTHLNRVIKAYDLDMIYRSGPGHGGNAMVDPVLKEQVMEDTYNYGYKNDWPIESQHESVFTLPEEDDFRSLERVTHYYEYDD